MEEWLPIPGYEGLYEVSDLGRIRRVGAAKGATVGAILRQQPHNAYLLVYLSRHGKIATLAVHRIVCYAFHGPPPLGKNHVLHEDDDGHNNRPGNLRWGTQAENNREMYAKGRGKKPRKR